MPQEHPSSTIINALAKLEADRKTLSDQVGRILEAHNRDLYTFDFLALAAIKRSLALSEGFCTLIRNQNFTCAGSILRLQLDTAIRFFAGFIVDAPHDFALEVIEGGQISKITDRKGHRMTDHYLLTQLIQKFPEYEWIKSVYKKTSNYIHFSNTHIFSMSNRTHHEDQSMYQIIISPRDNNIPDNIYLEAITAFHNSTEILVRHIEGWIFTKDKS